MYLFITLKKQYVGGLSDRRKYDLTLMAYTYCTLCPFEYGLNFWLVSALSA